MKRIKKIRGDILKKVRLRTYIALGLILVLTPLAFAAVYGVLGALGGSSVTPLAVWHFDEGVDNTCVNGTDDACDSSGNAYGMTRTSAVWQTEDKCVSGKCAFYDGDTDYFSAGDNAAFDFSTDNDFTISTWIRPNTVSGDYYIIIKGALEGTDTAANAGYALRLTNTNILAIVRDQTTTTRLNVTGSVNLSANKWYHVAVVFDRDANLSIYVDGNLDTATSMSAKNADLGNSNPLTVGTYSALVTHREFPGFIDETKIFASALTAAQVKAEFAGGAAVLGTQDTDFLNKGLVGYWKMDDAAVDAEGESSTDSSGNSNTGTLFGDNGVGDNGTGLDCTAAGKFGTGCQLDGVDDYVSVTSISNTAGSISVWIYLTQNAVTKGSHNRINSVFYQHSANNYIYLAGINDYFAVTPSENAWNHIVLTWDDNTDNSTAKLYVNGVAYSLTQQAGSHTVANLSTIGSASASFTGTLDEHRVYNRALSPAEVKALYNWAPGPVGYWPMDEASWTNDCSTSTVFDSSGNGNNGKACPNSTGPTGGTTGKFGKAGYFDGSDDDIQANTIGGNFGSDPYTLTAWIKPTNFSSTRSIVSAESATQFRWSVKSTGRLDFDSNSFVNPTTSNANIAAGVWQHVALVHTGSGTFKHYINGVDETSDASGNNSGLGDSPISIGNWSGDAFLGNIDEVKIYNYARTAQQIVEDMNAGHPTGGSPVGSHVAYWKFDEAYGTTANDDTTNDNDLTLSSASWTTSGKFNNAWNGTNAVWLSRADDADFDVSATDDYSISLWMKSDSTSNPAATEYLFNKANATTAGYAVYVDTSGFACFGIDDDATWGPDVSSCNATDIYDNTWHHIVAVRDYSGTDQTLIYIDGVLKDNDTDSTTATLANSLSLYVGDRDGTDNGDEFAGDLDEIKVYRSALTADQVKIVYNGGVTNNFGGGNDEKSATYGGPGGNDPVGYWSFDEKTGSTVYDRSGTGSNGTIVDGGSTTGSWTTGKYGSTYNLAGGDGSDVDHIRLSSAISLGTANTISFWINFNDINANGATLATSDIIACGTNCGYMAYFDNAGNLYSRQETGSAVSVSTGALSTNTWYHFTVVRSGTSVTFYQNGVQVGSTQTMGANNSFSMYSITNFNSGGANDFPYDGKLDELKVFDYAMTQSQVAYEYNRGAPVGWWRLDECTGTTANDAGSGGNNGTITPGDSTGNNDSAGNCSSGATAPTDEMWDEGTTGKFNASLDFDGTNDYVTMGDPSDGSLDFGTGDFSVSFWANYSTFSAVNVAKRPGGAGAGWRVGFTSTSMSFRLDDGTTPIETTCASGLSSIASTWHHGVFVFDRSGNLSCYLDGVLVGTYDISGTNLSVSNSSPFNLNTFNNLTSSATGVGQMDDVRVFNYTLSADQIKKLYNGGGAVRFSGGN